MTRDSISSARPSFFKRAWPLWPVVVLSSVIFAWALWLWVSHPSPAHRPTGPAIGLIVDINHADHATLAALPGLGPVTATYVLESRRELGRFEHIEAITRVHGIGQGKLEILRPHITAGPGVTIIPPEAHLSDTANLSGRAEKKDRPEVDLSLDDSVDAPYPGLSPEPQPSQE